MENIFNRLWATIKSPIGVVIGLAVIWHLILWLLRIPIHVVPSAITLIIDLVVVVILLDRWTYFFAQFVLPIQSPEERKQIYTRVKHGADGAALFIKNGEIVAKQGEEKKRGKGVILVDTASSAILRTDTEIRGTLAPGITFTSGGEYLAGTVDLRAQIQTVGPIPNDIPFPKPDDDIPPKLMAQMQQRRQETSGLTRDGFEVVPTLSIKFSIQRPQVEHLNLNFRVNSRYGFNPDAVEKAIVRNMVQPGINGQGESDLPWNKLPAHLAINLWREYVRKFTFSELFTTDEVSGLQTIEEMINKRMQSLNVVELNDTGSPTARLVPSLEAQHLQNRGISIEGARIHCVYFDPLLEEKIIKAWETNWLSNAKKEKKQLEEREALVDTYAYEEAVKSFADLASRKFSAKTRLSGNPFITLQLLFDNLRETVLNEHNGPANLEEELRKIGEFYKWLTDSNAVQAFGNKEEQL